MSENKPPLTPRLKFSLLHLLALTALIAISTAIMVASHKHRDLVQYRDDLRSLSSRLHDVGTNKLYAAEMTRVADSFHSWHVSVPQGQEFELRLGIGEVSQSVLPPVVGTVPIPAGQHRVTLYAADSSDEKFQYVVYLDGQPVIDKTMGSDWIPVAGRRQAVWIGIVSRCQIQNRFLYRQRVIHRRPISGPTLLSWSKRPVRNSKRVSPMDRQPRAWY